MTRPEMTQQDAGYGPMQAVRLVAGREISTRLRSKAFRITTAIMVLLVIALAIVMKLVTSASGPDATVGVTGRTAGLSAPLAASARTVGQTVDTRRVASAEQGRSQVTDGKLDALLVGGGSGGSTVRVVVQQELDIGLRTALDALARQSALNGQIRGLGGDPAAVGKAVDAAEVQVRPIEPPYPYDPVQLFLGAAAGVLIYLALMTTGQMVAQGVVEEKSSRVVELLLAVVKPWQMMTGKALGIGAVGLLQMVAIGVAGIAAGLVTGVLPSIPAAVTTVLWVLVWFVLGFAAYALVFAAMGALVSRQEDVGSVIMPPLMFVILGYVAGISVLPTDPGNRFVEVLSLLPPFAPTLMPMRLAMGGVPVWETVLALVLMIAVIPALVWLSARIYRNAIVRTGTRVKFRDALTTA